MCGHELLTSGRASFILPTDQFKVFLNRDPGCSIVLCSIILSDHKFRALGDPHHDLCHGAPIALTGPDPVADSGPFAVNVRHYCNLTRATREGL
jgi:hypothetical protein